jgi:hypothetical protein
MADSSQLFKDDEKERGGQPDSSDEAWNNIASRLEPDKAAMEQGAYNGAARDIAEREGLFNPGGDTGSEGSKGAVGKGALAAAEGAAAGAGAGSNLFNPVDKVPGAAGAALKGLRYITQHKKGAAIGGGGLTGVIGLILILSLGLAGLKIESIVSNLESHFFSTSNNAVENETNNAFKEYLAKYVGPAMRKCKVARIDRSCNVNGISGTNPVSNLYKSWSQAKLEDTMAEKYGIELAYNSNENGGTWHLLTPGDDSTAAGADNIISDGNDAIPDDSTGGKLDTVMTKRSDVRQAVNGALENETGWKKIMMRYKVGKLLEEKYGIKRCIVYCGKQDAFADAKTQKKYAAKAFLVERVITPRSAALGAVIGCLLSTTQCNGNAPPTCAESTCDEEANAPETEASAAVEQAVGEASGGFGSETGTKLMQTISDSRAAGGFQNYLINQAVIKIFGDEAGENAVPIAGQIALAYKVAQFVGEAGKASSKLKYFSYIANAGAAVSLYEMYSSYADEIHTGHADATEVGSFNDSLGPGNQCDASSGETCPTNPDGTPAPVDGTGGAESTPLYGALIDGNTAAAPSSASTSLLNDILPAAAYADPTSSSSTAYKCNGGSSVPADSLVCPEEALGQSNSYVDGLSSSLNKSGLSTVASAVTGIPFLGDIISGISGATGYLVSGLFGLIPGVSGLEHAVSSQLGNLFDFLINKIVPSPFSPDESGGRTFDMMAAGADVAGNDYAHTGLGGQMLTPAQVATIDNQQSSEDKAAFDQQPLFARMFSTDNPDSLVSRMALDMPSSSSDAMSSFASYLSNPLGTISHSFASLLSGKSDAAAPLATDPFGVTQYGYPSVPDDPETYYQQNCTDGTATQTWDNTAATTTDSNGQPLNTTPDPCLLIQAMVGSAGAEYNTSLLSPDEQTELNSPSPSSADSSGSSSFESSLQTSTDSVAQASKSAVLSTAQITATIDTMFKNGLTK